ncbi:YhjD/YihY/BrkB family envelope integrity protein [Actinophytocola sp.]|uniref:YhjD/YihY/BrkB family envelope integrity protein n=1 Tax=Actinophytocola sp. TaxID=1872138 RepID=UPI002D7FEC56|nr:YhjD/YihY/BrkB family envelope integrity protein [Actinophytocola sp.]HET9139570.1 YhjD/YihY/BrkB family envelope integrity protein [Actinophytocola sp.]HEU5111421.1 YhjD/YihY/BrkB family envelope integrity protein [Micromonosporaceae bacterium]
MSALPKRTAGAEAFGARAFGMVRRRLRPVVGRVMSNWPGRILLRTGAAFVRLELFDRSMMLAAQLFTSVFPLLIMAAVVFGQRYGDQVADAAGLPEGTRRVLDEALAGGGFSAFGVFGALIVLISSTSLARAMIRAFGAIWLLPRIRRDVRFAWRLLAAVVLLAAAVVLVRLLILLAGRLPVSYLAVPVLTFAADSALAVALPWILLARAVPLRLLVPGGVVFGLMMLAVRPMGAVYLPRALLVSLDRYGTIGLAFTYIGWLYILSFCYLGAAVVGHVLAQDESRLGRFIRGGEQAPWQPVTPDGEPAPVAGNGSQM